MEGARVLLVEDEEHIAFGVQFNLEAEGCVVDVAGTLAEARELLERGYDLFVLDVMLPDGSGFDLCVELRSEGNLTPVLMLTAKGATDDVVTGLNSGADGYMTKPFELRELLVRIAAMLRRGRWEAEAQRAVAASTPPGGAVMEFGGNRVDFLRREASARGEAVELTELEFRLLRFFDEREGEAVSREELLENVWGVLPQTNTRTVDNFLVRLRRLFELDPANPVHFTTVRGVGYRFVRGG